MHSSDDMERTKHQYSAEASKAYKEVAPCPYESFLAEYLADYSQSPNHLTLTFQSSQQYLRRPYIGPSPCLGGVVDPTGIHFKTPSECLKLYMAPYM